MTPFNFQQSVECMYARHNSNSSMHHNAQKGIMRASRALLIFFRLENGTVQYIQCPAVTEFELVRVKGFPASQSAYHSLNLCATGTVNGAFNEAEPTIHCTVTTAAGRAALIDILLATCHKIRGHACMIPPFRNQGDDYN